MKDIESETEKSKWPGLASYLVNGQFTDISKHNDSPLYQPNPNGVKISVALELLVLSYKPTQINILTNEQEKPFFLEINPNSRIRALTCTLNSKPIRLCVSGSVLQYLIEQ